MTAKSSKSVETIVKLNHLRRRLATWRAAGETIALVPTMGALHDGHLSLLKRAQRKADRTVVSIFVNPGQFAPNEDLDSYPRDPEGDIAKISEAKADLIWAPTVNEMYAQDFSTKVQPGSASAGLETDFRPHFFGGVTTVCCKLFNQVTPDFAMFGEKDYQQLCVIRQMVRDLDMRLKIVGVPTVRGRDGLALSSRNAYLSPIEREIAPSLHATLKGLAEAAADGRRIGAAETRAKVALVKAGFKSIDYIVVRDAETLGAWQPKTSRPGRALVAAWLGKTRLIDNIAVSKA